MHDLDLQGVGVLEFVDEHDGPAAAQLGAHVLVVAQEPLSQDEEVVEVQRAVAASSASVVEHDPAQPAEQMLEAGGAHGGELRLPRLVSGLQKVFRAGLRYAGGVP